MNAQYKKLTDSEKEHWKKAIDWALNDIYNNGYPNKSTGYNVIYKKSKLPPKGVIQRAFDYLDNNDIETSIIQIKGGEDTNTFLQSFGLSVYPKIYLKDLIGQIEVWEDWRNSYQKFVPLFIKEAATGKNWNQWDQDIFYEFFEKAREQCIASMQQGYFSNEEKDKIKENWHELAPLLKILAQDQDYPYFDIYNQIKDFIRKYTSQNKKAATNRLIASLHPQFLSTIVNEDMLRDLYGYLNLVTDDFQLKYSGDWFQDSFKILSRVQEASGIDNVYEIVTIPWQLYELLKDDAHLKLQDNISMKEIKILSQPLNQILYGPPGTGKTYNTINKAIAIANPDFDLSEDRKSVKAEYQSLVDAGQIVFTTFHQSMTYEDFIEGIKPETKDNNVIYNIKNGLFKEIAIKALDNWKNVTSQTKDKIPFDKVFQLLKDEWEENPMLEFPMKREGNDFKILGFSDSSINFLKASGTNNHTLSINTLRDLYYGIREFQNQGVGIYYPSIIDKLNSYDVDFEQELVINEKKNYVIIIDEINRGNVSQIFGELITLIEEDKRLGNDEALEVTLPYSKEKFGVPSNLYIIGTMNTADRSVEALDTALRRRFIFEEMPPKYDLDGLQQELYSFKAAEILQTINKRIEKLLDRDHQIGHAYFINKNETSIIDSFYKNIIPLLQEYFFGDYGKIGLVLGSGFINKIEQESVFANFEHLDYSQFEEKELYEIINHKDNFEGFGEAINLLMNR